VAGPPLVVDERILVHSSADAAAPVIGEEPVAGLAGGQADGEADVIELGSGLGCADTSRDAMDDRVVEAA
jgi:hypothetical protein